MKISIDKKELLSMIAKAQNIVEKRNTMPVLINVLLEAKDSTVKIFATDLEVSLTDESTAKISHPGRAAVNAKSFFDILKELPEGEVHLEKLPNNWLKIKQLASEFNIVGIGPDEYPVFPGYSTNDFMSLDVDVFKEMIEKTIYSVSNDETRYHLNGVFFERHLKEGKTIYRMVATDGHRLSLVDRSGDSGGISSTAPVGVIIPRKGLAEIRKLLDLSEDRLEMAIEGSQLIVRSGSTVLMIRLIEGKYPNYQQLIPKNLVQLLVVNRESLLASLKRVSLLSNSKSKGVTLSLKEGKLEISSNNPELGDAREEIEVNYGGKEMKIGFNAKYLLDVLTSMTEEKVQVELNDQLSPGLVRPQNDETYTCVVMPMRI